MEKGKYEVTVKKVEGGFMSDHILEALFNKGKIKVIPVLSVEENDGRCFVDERHI